MAKPLIPLVSLIAQGRFSVGQLAQVMEEKVGLATSTTLTAIYQLRRKQAIELSPDPAMSPTDLAAKR